MHENETKPEPQRTLKYISWFSRISYIKMTGLSIRIKILTFELAVVIKFVFLQNILKGVMKVLTWEPTAPLNNMIEILTIAISISLLSQDKD